MKRLLTLSLALLIIISSGSLVFAKDSDYETSWAKYEINYMKEKGILKGYTDGTFRPENNMSKVEFYKVINGLMNFTEKEEDIDFQDVHSSRWYYEEVQKGVKAGYILPSPSLNPNLKITRGEAVRIINVVFKIEENQDVAKEFVDYDDIPYELRGVIGGLKHKGFINGYPDGTFNTDANITRAEVVKMLYNISK